MHHAVVGTHIDRFGVPDIGRCGIHDVTKGICALAQCATRLVGLFAAVSAKVSNVVCHGYRMHIRGDAKYSGRCQRRAVEGLGSSAKTGQHRTGSEACTSIHPANVKCFGHRPFGILRHPCQRIVERTGLQLAQPARRCIAGTEGKRFGVSLGGAGGNIGARRGASVDRSQCFGQRGGELVSVRGDHKTAATVDRCMPQIVNTRCVLGRIGIWPGARLLPFDWNQSSLKTDGYTEGGHMLPIGRISRAGTDVVG
ncbi:hypothetical protein D3C81_1064620 [compost metagenome]